MGSEIEISRPKGKGPRRDMLRRYKVLINDVEVATLREGESHRAGLDPGTYGVGAQIDWAVTPTVDVVLGDEVVRLVVRPGGAPRRGLSQAVRRPEEYLVLERV
jgi:hypothetical protein